MKYDFRELVDVEALQMLFDELNRAITITTAILTVDGEILTASGWQRICSCFHRIHPETARDCTISDTMIRKGLDAGEPFVMYRCPRGLIDASSPVIIEGEHVANVFIGQFFDEPPTDETELFFREQARKFNLEEEEYIRAYRDIPVYPEEKYRSSLAFLVSLAHLVSSIGLARLREKEALTIVAENEKKYRRLIESTNTVPWELDLSSGSFIYMGPRIERILGYSPDYFDTIETFTGIVHSEDRAMVLNVCTSSGNNDHELEIEFRMIASDNREVWIRNACSSIKDDGASRLIGFMTDITEKKKSEAEREMLKEQLLQSQKMDSIGRLAGGIAHDFNNLLTVISGNAELMLDSMTSSDINYTEISEIQECARRAAQLTRQLLAFSRRQIIDPHVLNLNTVLLNLDPMIRRLIGENIDILFIPCDNIWNVNVDAGQMEQVITNLIVNARDAMPYGGKLTIETRNVTIDDAYARLHNDVFPGRFAMIAVSDTGVGIDPITKKKLFEPFFTTKERGKGVGLGLSTCFGIVKQNNGFMTVYSEAGHGAVFKVYLPAVDKKVETAPMFEENDTRLDGTETILVVEDEPGVRTIMLRNLRNHGYTVFETANGEEAVQFLKEHPAILIDLVVTDVIMPRMGGKELYETMRASNPSQKVLFISGYSENMIAHHGVLDRGLNFLGKPFLNADFLAKVREILDR